jgi:polyphosphate kinase 2 (PPK2 family)
MAKSFAAQFRIEPGKRAHLGRRDPADLKAFPDRKAAEKQSVKDGEAIDGLQDRLYAEGKRALLVVLQGIDTAGKDGTIKHIFKEAGPLGVAVTAFRSRARRSWRTISCGAPISPSRAAASSASSAARITRMLVGRVLARG